MGLLRVLIQHRSLPITTWLELRRSQRLLLVLRCRRESSRLLVQYRALGLLLVLRH